MGENRVMPEAVTKSERGARRRDRILRAAAELMARDGYPAVSMAQIGASAGIVGSGVYRHFDSKATILRELIAGVIAAMSEGTRELVDGGLTGPSLLEALLRRQAEVAIANRALVAVYLRDSGNLADADQHDLRRRQRVFVDEWMRQFGTVAPAVGQAELRTVVQAVFALINSTATYENPLPAEVLVDRISEMAVATMRAGLGLEDAVDPES